MVWCLRWMALDVQNIVVLFACEEESLEESHARALRALARAVEQLDRVHLRVQLDWERASMWREDLLSVLVR